MPAPWEIQPSEPPRWYARFEAYRRLGPTRSIERVFEAEVDAGAVNGRRPGQAWYKAAREWRWQERAEAWDAAERERLAAAEHARRFDRREARLGHIQRLLVTIVNVLATADIDHVDKDTARAMLPVLRLFFRDLLMQERAELGLPVIDARPQGGEAVSFTGDELAQAMREVRAWSGKLAQGHGEVAYLALRNVLAALYPAEASIRRVIEQAGLRLERVRLGASALDDWHAVLAEAQKAGAMRRIIEIASWEYASNRELQSAVHEYQTWEAGHGK